MNASLPLPRLLFVIDSLAGAGGERILAYTANSLVRDGYQVEIVLTFDDVRSYPLDHRVLVTSLAPPSRPDTRRRTRIASRLPKPRHVARLLRTSLLLARRIRETRPDCVISFLPKTNLVALFARRLFRIRVPMICADHNTLSREIRALPAPAVSRLLARVLYPSASLHIACSNGAAEDLHEFLRIPRHDIRTIYYGIDLDAVRHASLEELPPDIAAHLTRTEALKIVAVGRLTGQKNHEGLLHAFSEVSRQIDCDLFLVGEGPLQSGLEALANQLGIADRVHFLGWRPNPHSIVRMADVLVLSSKWEGLPVVLIEALAIGTAVVSTDCPSGPREILNDGEAGLLTTPDDPHDLARHIVALARDPVLRERLRTAGSRRAQLFSLSSMVREYRDAITVLCGPTTKRTGTDG